MSQLSREIVEACEALGFASAGICAAAPTERGPDVRAWLGEGCAGSMDWMHEWLDVRLDVRGLVSNLRQGGATADPGDGTGSEIRSVIVVADQYAEQGGEDADGPAAERTGRIAKYARGRDYHDVVRRRLHVLADALRARFPREQFRSFVDTGPVLEREHAARAGLGFIGKHTLLIDARRGSYLLLGGIATSLVIEPTASGEIESHCGSCTRCIDACPTGAISPYRVDARRCISYLTIEHEGLVDRELHAGMGDWLFGCDVCQDVCPFNAVSHPGVPRRVHPLYREREGLVGGRLRLLDVLRWTPEDRRVALTVSAGKRASLDMLRRNAVIAAGNGGEIGEGSELGGELRRVAAEDASPVVRDTAIQVLGT